jgi:4'-phosphopantetheinyl transferase EntD
VTDALVRGLLPDDVAWACSEIGDATAELFPEEAAFVARAVPKRQREFARGRVCARRALETLGLPAQSVLVGSSREPLWPDGVVGSITHDNAFCVAVAALGERYAGLGVDVEPDAPLEDKIAARIWSPAEAESASRSGVVELPIACRLVFCAKEAVYKCQFPVTQSFVGFHDVTVELGEGTFEATFEKGYGTLARGTRLTGTWRRTAGEIVTAVTLPRR